MLKASIAFFLLAILAYIFGANSIAGFTLEIGRTLLFIFIFLSVISFIYSLFRGTKLN